MPELHLEQRLTDELVLDAPVFAWGTVVPRARHGADYTGLWMLRPAACLHR
jgi:hypothetical protein